jgi:hypothetical protein
MPDVHSSLPAQAKGSMADALLWDEDYAALCDASLVVVDLDCGAGGSAEGAAAAEEAVAAAEARIVATGAAMARCGLRNLLCDLWLQGTQVGAPSQQTCTCFVTQFIVEVYSATVV